MQSSGSQFTAPQALATLLQAALLGCLISLAGCGNKGALYLPSTPEAQPAASTSPTEATKPDAAPSATSEQ